MYNGLGQSYSDCFVVRGNSRETFFHGRKKKKDKRTDSILEHSLELKDGYVQIQSFFFLFNTSLALQPMETLLARCTFVHGLDTKLGRSNFHSFTILSAAVLNQFAVSPCVAIL